MSKIILVGSDPEMFTKNLATGKISSVAGKLGCDKWNKLVMEDGLNIQEDNVLIEFDIKPHSSFETFSKDLSRGIEVCNRIANSVEHEVVHNVCSHLFTMDEIKSFHRNALVFGCEPDYNALTGMQNPKPAAADPGLRTAGGHIHLGYIDSLPEGMDADFSKAVVGVMCDYHLGLMSLLLDSDDRRRELYGKAGAIRMKDYGIEYRTMSNFWIFKEDIRKIVWDQAMKAVAAIQSDEWERLTATIDPAEIQRAINENDKRAADLYLKKLKLC